MSNDNTRRTNGVSIPLVLLRSIIAGALGVIVGAIAFGWGIYFASYSDMVMPFYPAGAIAGGVAAIAYVLLSAWSADHPKRAPARPFLAAGFGTIALWAAMSNPILGMELSSRAVAATIWFGSSSFVLFLIASKARAVLGG